jgi:hypothetical protein
MRALKRRFRNGRYHWFDARLPWRQQFREYIAQFRPVCAETLIRVDEAAESPKLAQ